MSKQYPGGLITKTPVVPTQVTASGVWTLDQQAYWQKLGQWPTPGYKIARSLRFNSADSAYLNRTPASAGNLRTWTWSAWVKRGSLTSASGFAFFNQGGVSTNYTLARFTTSDTLDFQSYGTSAFNFQKISTAVYRDPSAWYHIVFVLDATNTQARIYVNGAEVAYSTNVNPSNADQPFNQAALNRIGYTTNNVLPFDGYMTEVNFIDGQALTPSSFGETNAQTGVWSPIGYSGSYGTNGFYLNFSDNSNTTAATLGKDYSGNGNNWTPTAGVGNDSLVDTPTPYGVDTGAGGNVGGNYATLNAVDTATTSTLSNGNLNISLSGASGSSQASTIAMTSGKWYWEVTESAVTNQACQIGIMRGNIAPATITYTSNPSGVYYAAATGNKNLDGTQTAYGTAWGSTGTTYVIGIALDADAGTVTFYLNNTSQGLITLPSNTNGWRAQSLWSSGSGTGTLDFNFGQRPFAYTAPSGFLALCTQNLPTPTIGATSATLANKYFDINLWTGNGSSQTLTNTGGFQPDWVWLKSRSSGTNFHNLFDVIRGATKHLFSNTTAAEGTNAQSLTAFTSTGFSVGNDNDVNQSSSTYVGWQWKAGGTGVSNASGTITSTVSASTTSGFSVVTFTAPSSGSGTVGHGLGVAPNMMIWKSRSNADSWTTYHSSLGGSSALFLNSTGASFGLTWGTINSTLFTADTSQNCTASRTYVAYCFAAVAGYSAFGSYTGNGSANGPFVYTGFRPAFVMVKNTAAGENWVMLDATRNTSNVTNNKLAANSSVAENDASIGDSTQNNFDFLSNGFKAVTTNSGTNGSSAVIIYMAFASNPFKYSLAR